MTDSDAPPVPARGWGILGTGYIADLFAADLPAAEHAQVRAVASRDADRAAAFAARHGIGTWHGSYETLLADPAVECVYLALPNHLHLEWTERAAQAGKHVLCENPLAMNEREAGQAVETARRHGVVLLEGFMYRMHPQITELTRLLEAGTIGEVRVLEASFGGNMHGSHGNYRMQRAAGGGALMDLGCYGVSFAEVLHTRQIPAPLMGPEDSLGNMRVLDAWRRAIGLKFDQDQEDGQ